MDEIACVIAGVRPPAARKCELAKPGCGDHFVSMLILSRPSFVLSIVLSTTCRENGTK
jgi:hypothetical protein